MSPLKKNSYSYTLQLQAIGHCMAIMPSSYSYGVLLMSQSKGLFGSITDAVVATVSTVTTTATAINRLATAGDELAKVAENKAKRFGELIEIKDQMIYNEAKSQLDLQVEALTATLKKK